MARAQRRPRHLDLHQPASHHHDPAAARADHLAHDPDVDHLDRHRGADGRAGGVEARHLGRPVDHDLRRVRLLRAGVRGGLPDGLRVRARRTRHRRQGWRATRLRSRRLGRRQDVAGAGLHAAVPRHRALDQQPDPAIHHIGRRLHRADRAHHPRDHARGAEPGLRAHRARQGGSATRRSCSCTRSRTRPCRS